MWGWTFVVVKRAVSHYAVLPFLGIRFLLAALILWALVGFRFRHAPARTGLLIGAVLAIGYLAQTLGLQRTSVANTGLITGLFVVFTPILDLLLFRVPTRSTTWAAVAVAFAGTGLLTGAAPAGLRLGDLLVLVGAVAFALHITLLSRFAGSSPLGLAAWQMTAAAALFLAGAGATHSAFAPMPSDVPMALLITGVFASAIAFWVQTAVQRRLPAARAALILTLEPAFTVVFAFWLNGERFSAFQGLGAALILAALFFNEFRERRPVGAAAPVEVPFASG